MSQEDKFKEAQRLYETANADQRYVLERLFPSLRESEDERTRKEIVRFIRMEVEDEIVGNKWLAWLEKQVEPEDKGEISDGYHTFNELYYYRMLYNAAFFNSLPKAWVHKSKKHHDGEECFGGGWFIVMANLPTGQISNHYELKDWELFQIPEKEVADEWDGHTPKEAAERLHKYLLRQKEQELLCDKCRKDNPYSSCQEVTAFGNCAVENEFTQANKIEPKSTERKESTSISFGTDSELIEEIIKIPDGYVATIESNKIHIKREGKSATEAIKEEKVDNTNKVEPTFKVDDWVMLKAGINFHDDRKFAKITEIDEYGKYWLDCGTWVRPDEIRLWTIEDVQDGDVLAVDPIDGYPSPFVAIYKERDLDSFKSHCFIGFDGYFYEGEEGHTIEDMHPATKEQRGILFQKMKEDGYSWNVDKKELIRIE